MTRRRATIDCGRGSDTVFYGRVRPKTRNCQRVISRYNGTRVFRLGG
jgi:hypothetical protein